MLGPRAGRGQAVVHSTCTLARIGSRSSEQHLPFLFVQQDWNQVWDVSSSFVGIILSPARHKDELSTNRLLEGVINT